MKTDEIIMMIAENFGATLTERMLFMWQSLLEEYPIEAVKKAALALLKNTGTDQVAYKSMPPFAIMQRELDAVSGVMTSAKDVSAAKSESAWEKLLRSIETYGSYRMPDFDPTLAYCVRSLGGWSVVCNWRESDINWRKKEFMELYALADGKVDLLDAGPDAIESISRHAIGASTKESLGGFMQSLKERNMKAIANG